MSREFDRHYCVDGSYVEVPLQRRSDAFEPPPPLTHHEISKLTPEEYKRRVAEIKGYAAMMEAILNQTGNKEKSGGKI